MAELPFVIHSSAVGGSNSPYSSQPPSRDQSSRWKLEKTGMEKPSTLIQAILHSYKGSMSRQNSMSFSPMSSRRDSNSGRNLNTREAVLQDLCIKDEPYLHSEKIVDDREGELDKENRVNHENTRSKVTLEPKDHPEKDKKRGLRDSKSGKENGSSTARGGGLTTSRPDSPTTNDVPNWYEEKLPVIDTRMASNPPVRIIAPYGAYVKAKPTLFGGKINCQIKQNGFVQPTGMSKGGSSVCTVY